MGATTFTSIEHIDIKALNTMINNYDNLELTQTQRKPIIIHGKEYPVLSLLKKLQKALIDGKLYTNYEYSKNHSITGRQFAKTPSLQGLKRWIRHTLSSGYHDYDIVNCHPTILHQYCKKKNYDVHHLENYILNRETLLPDMNVDRDSGKEVILSLLNGGTQNYTELETKPMWLKDLKNEIHGIHSKIMEDEENQSLVESVIKSKTSKKNIEGSVMNHLLCHIENKIIMEAIEFLSVKDPLLMFDGFQCQAEYRPETLSLLEAHIFNTIGYDVKIIEKPMEEGLDLSAYQEGDKGDGMTDFSAAKCFYDWALEKGIQMVRVCGEGLWYNSDRELWECDFKEIKTILNQCDLLDFVYQQFDNFQNKLLNQLFVMIPKDDDWYMNIKQHQKGFLPLANGVWDFKTKKLVKYEAKYGFFYKMKVKYNPDLNTKLVNQRLFENLFHKDDCTYLKCMLARALANEADKNLFFLLGDGNSGKGFFEAALKVLLGKLLGTINAGNLVHKKNNGDEAKSLSWLVKLKDCSICIGQEVRMEDQLSGGIFKKIASGGDIIEARVNYKDEINFYFWALTLICANDVPKINGLDDAFKNRIGYFEMPNVYLPIDADYKGCKNRILIDESIKKDWINQPEVAEQFLLLLLNSYSSIKPNMPAHLLKVKEEWNESSEDVHSQITQLFEPTFVMIDSDKKDEDGDFIQEIQKIDGVPVPLLDAFKKPHFVTADALIKFVVSKGIQVSAKKLGSIMTGLGYSSSQKKIDKKCLWVYKNIKLINNNFQDY